MELKTKLEQSGLTMREAEIGCLVMQGQSNKEIASLVNISEKTVKFHLTNVYKKIGVGSRAQFIVKHIPFME